MFKIFSLDSSVSFYKIVNILPTCVQKHGLGCTVCVSLCKYVFIHVLAYCYVTKILTPSYIFLIINNLEGLYYPSRSHGTK